MADDYEVQGPPNLPPLKELKIINAPYTEAELRMLAWMREGENDAAQIWRLGSVDN